ncbi:peptidoglycan bridge formation glycyltransferase FemA/FemB family protein (plasmid) [Aliiroseovarius sp. M344]|uniref:GNAT family N-acetyltransferase n=1 Tax=Aliiroseovarius sp. M344 TaxID=2867010 RepID=UPI0021ADA74E|nr:GNAT family N-acetyltransferase [Aliiroseovarius sp. M344]UWQ16084.1 peptidoglycan bridge formation glycyltransferase FemA/FemB family protein [Aliiroseovarius sp. M344]
MRLYYVDHRLLSGTLMDIECLSDLEPEQAAEWDAFLAASPSHHPRQDHRFAQTERQDGAHVMFVLGRIDGALAGVGLLSMTPHPFLKSSYRDAIFLSGPICNDVETMIAFLTAALAHPDFSRIGRVRITPYWLEDDAKALHDALEQQDWSLSSDGIFRSTGLIDISAEPDVIMARFSKSARREVRRAERAGVTVRPITDEAGAVDFLHSLNRLRTGRGLFALAEKSFLQSFEDIYKTGDMGMLLGAFSDANFISGLLMYRSMHTAHGRHFTTETAALSALKNLRISPLLWLEGMKWARSKGCEFLDVEGYVETTDSSDKKYNIYKYKSELAPKAVIRIGERSKTANRFLHLTGNGSQLAKAAARRKYRVFKGLDNE